MPAEHWRVVILAASRGPDDPMARAYGLPHKCALPIAGKPMLAWVVDALRSANLQTPFLISIDNAKAATAALGSNENLIQVIAPLSSAPASARVAIQQLNHVPVLITTGDHPLLTKAMLTHMIGQSEEADVDVLVALATSDVITKYYPHTRRTYFNLGGTRVSGCNLFAIKTVAGLKLVEAWEEIERDRKKPWKLVARFGLKPLVYYALGLLTPERAFRMISEKIGVKIAPVFMPFAEAAIDVDKPEDLQLAETMLRDRALAPGRDKLPR